MELLYFQQPEPELWATLPNSQSLQNKYPTVNVAVTNVNGIKTVIQRRAGVNFNLNNNLCKVQGGILQNSQVRHCMYFV